MFTCSQCPTSFKNKTSLKEHVVKHHIGIKNFSCDTCGKEFYSKQNLRVAERLFMVQTEVTFSFGPAVFSSVVDPYPGWGCDNQKLKKIQPKCF
jgi:hypothetical protein